ncbi:MAG TPA: hypothetical protein VF250_17005 [Conexibacter sp.]
MSIRRQALALLVVALAALVALPAAGIAARRRASKVPRAGTTLTSGDQRVRLTVVAGRARNGKRVKFVNVEWDLDVTCTNGPALAHLRARAPVRGNAFTRTVNAGGTKQRITGRFTSVHKATGDGELTFPTPDGGSCRTGVERFTVQG